MPSIERIYPGLLWCCCKCHHGYNTVAKDFFWQCSHFMFVSLWLTFYVCMKMAKQKREGK